VAVYAVNGRQLFKTSFKASETKENILGAINKIPAGGVYVYRFLQNKKVMDEGYFVVR